jgi:ribose-phosphate pyrophosphokinase
MLESVGMSRILVIDAHNPAAFENAFRYAVAENLEAFSLFSGPLSTELEKNTPLVVLAPDLGGVKRAESFRKALSRELQREIGFAFLEKHRRHEFVGLKGGAELEESEVLIIDDMISTGETILRALEACRRGGAKCASVMATHGLFCGNVSALLEAPELRQIIVTDSIDQSGRPARISEVSCAPLLAKRLGSIFDWKRGRHAA